MKTLTLLFALSAIVILAATPAFAGRCVNPWDTASDGSRCGGRASTIRPGGNDGPYYPRPR